jgi:integrase
VTAMEHAKLTALEVKRAYRSGKRLPLGDGDELHPRKQNSDSASWVLRYRHGGKQRWLTLGNFPAMPLVAARIEVRQARVLLDKQQDPMHLRRAAKAGERQRGSFKDLCDDWFRNEVEGRGIKHPGVRRRHLDKYVAPKLGRMAAVGVTPSDIARVIDAVKARAPTAANDLLRFVRRIFAFGVRRRIVPSSPAADFSPWLDGGRTERPRNRALSTDELADLVQKIRETETFGDDNLLAMKLLLALCVCKGELFGAPWKEFDLEGRGKRGPFWNLPASRTNTGDPLNIPLAPAVVEWLKVLQVACAGIAHILPKRRQDHRNRMPDVAPDTLNVAMIRVKHGLPHFTLHDSRRTARTRLAALGILSEVAERCLGHKLRGVEGTYNRYDYLDERRSALAQWSRLITQTELSKKSRSDQWEPMTRGARLTDKPCR